MECRPSYAVAANQWEWLMRHGVHGRPESACSLASQGQTGDNWLGMVASDGIAVSVAVGIGLGTRYML